MSHRIALITLAAAIMVAGTLPTDAANARDDQYIAQGRGRGNGGGGGGGPNFDNDRGRGAWVDGSIYGGLRTQTLVCAAQTLNDPVITAAALRDAQTMIRSYGSHREVAIGTNNTELIRQLGALAAYCWVADTPGRDRAWSNVVAISKGLVEQDGSDVEGSPGYGQYIEKLLKRR